MRLRDYQANLVEQVAGSTDDVLVQLATGAGKTPIIACIAGRVPTLVVAHRDVLVTPSLQPHDRARRPPA